MTKEEFKRRLLEEMCIVARNADFFRGRGVKPDKILFKQFKPGVGDRLLFNKIVNESITNLMEEANCEMYGERLSWIDFNLRLCALNLMNLFYCQYLPEEEIVPKEKGMQRFVSDYDGGFY